jgi:hypothetical protein
MAQGRQPAASSQQECERVGLGSMIGMPNSRLSREHSEHSLQITRRCKRRGESVRWGGSLLPPHDCNWLPRNETRACDRYAAPAAVEEAERQLDWLEEL